MRSTPRRALLLLPVLAACGGAPATPPAGPAATATAAQDDVPEPRADELPGGVDRVRTLLAAPDAPARIEGFGVHATCFKKQILDSETMRRMIDGTAMDDEAVSIKDP